MSNPFVYKMGGLASALGGLLGATAHVLRVDPPADPAQLAHYVRLSQPLNLVLFCGGLLVMLGLTGQFLFQCSKARIAGLLAFLFLYVGILLGDMLRCVLEFSVFPLLIATVPYATPALAQATYHSAPFAVLALCGKGFLFTGLPLTVFSILRSRVLPGWSAIPFAIAAVLRVVDFITATAVMVHMPYETALYLSMAILGIAVFRASSQNSPLRRRQRFGSERSVSSVASQ